MDDDEGGPWAIKCAEQIAAKCYPNMGVTYSSDGEYTNSHDVLIPFQTPDAPMAEWRVAKSLPILLAQANLRWPNRSKANDGTIASTEHRAQSPDSDHNEDDEGVVRAMDITLDLVEGEKLAEALRLSKDPRISYVIHNGRIFNSKVSPWVWRDRNKGPGDHTEHVHISVVKDDALADDTRAWDIGGTPINRVPIEVPEGDDLNSGKGSWYSQYSGKYEWIDHGDQPNSNALGVPDDAQGVAFYDRATLGKWFMTYAPNGKNSIEQQTDIGPHPSTGRLIDISAAAAERFGYSPKNFPTDSIFKWRPVPAPVSGTPQEQAVKFRDLRSQTMPPPDPVIDGDLAKIAAAVAELRSIASTQDVRISTLEHKTMPDTAPQQPQVDWVAALKAIEVLLPLIPKVLPALELLLPLLSGRAPVVAAQTMGLPVSGSVLSTILGVATAVLGGLAQAKGWTPPGVGEVGMVAGSGLAAGGVVTAVNKPKAQP